LKKIYALLLILVLSLGFLLMGAAANTGDNDLDEYFDTADNPIIYPDDSVVPIFFAISANPNSTALNSEVIEICEDKYNYVLFHNDLQFDGNRFTVNFADNDSEFNTLTLAGVNFNNGEHGYLHTGNHEQFTANGLTIIDAFYWERE